ncbi:hydroxyethylthiazole kinase [Staphylococcus pasteuri]|uniref:hydroxyethylthiazole kinase n=1 Tax=Staphylococcus pasteuri TaxID=45972 RepID=UPI001E5DDBC6|nr:hydroxyethylthiazole kinase [Staphylococcus pasteuri]MCD9067606.1 hydroxyethylthiazole kinase [Staphylococcus pasteuri]WAE40272.1 hydroxyethylthiazole kinase [Staphylococcus pasteuri]
MNNLEKLRNENPLIVCYTNDVVKNFTANGLLSIGASPAMSEAPEEARDFYKVAGGLLINIGTLTHNNEDDLKKIGKIANELETPIVFDPVAVGASQYRKDFCKRFLDEVDVSVIKGNASEILTLVDSNTTMKGTDGDSELNVLDIANDAYKKYQTAIVITGEHDIVMQDNKMTKLSNGSSMSAKITGAGCLLGGIIASFLFRNTKPKHETLVEAVSFYNIAGEIAASEDKVKGPGSFLPELLDQMYLLDYKTYEKYVKKEEVD